MTYLRDNLGEDLAAANLVISGERPLLVRSDGEIIDLLRKGQGVLSVVALSGVLAQIDSAIHELRPTQAIDAAEPPRVGRRAAAR